MAARRLAATLFAVAIGLVAVVVGAAAAVAVFGVTTTAGARAALAVANQLLPGEIAVGAVSGSLAGGLQLTDVRYDSPSVRGELRRLEVEPALAEWLEGRIVLERLALTSGTVNLGASAESVGADDSSAHEPFALPAVPSWLEVRKLRAMNLELPERDAALTELAASIEGPRIRVDRLSLRYGDGRIEAEGNLRVDGAISGRIEGSYVMDADEASGAASGGEELRAELAANIDVTGGSGERLRAELKWQPLAVHAADADWTSERGRLLAELDGDVLIVAELAADVLGGRIEGSGAVNIAAIAGHANLDYEMLDASRAMSQLDGRVSGSIVAAFASAPSLIAGAVATAEGTIGGEPLVASVRARRHGETTHIDRARVTLARGSIEAGGTIGGHDLDVSFDAAIPQVRNWYPSAMGAVTASGSVAGPISNPAIDARVSADGLTIDGMPAVQTLRVAVSGTTEQHSVRGSATSSAGTFAARVQQGWNGERVAGMLLESTLAVERVGEWSLTAPAAYSVAASSPSLERACFEGPATARLCASFDAGTLEVNGDDIPAALAAAAAGSDVRVTGAADLALTLQLTPLTGSFRLTQPVLGLQPAENDGGAPGVELATVENLSLTGALSTAELALELTARLATTGDPIAGRLSLTPPSAEGALDAELTARLSSLSPVGGLVENVDDLEGSVAIDLHAAGTPAAPVLGGTVVAESVSAVVPALGIAVTNARVTARAESPDAVTFDASLCSSACLDIGGSLHFRTPAVAWELDAALRGDGFVLADLPDLRAVIAPELTLNATPQRWLVEGELAIEQGLLAVEDIPAGAARPVPETVIHGAAAQTEHTGELPIPLLADVTVNLGEVRFAGLGISAELDGRVDIERTLDGQLLVTGTTSIEEGTFSAYGQELTIERGDLLFTGPTDNPALDIRATREVEGATVGLTITGTLRTPQSEVFSMPTLDETEALARLITGRSLQNAAPADGEAIERAALGLGIRRALPALDRLGARLGLDELGVDSAGSESGALVAGRQLGEDVYLRYKHGLFDDFAGLELIYRLTERFRLRTETGTSQSLDLIYERNPREETALSETESPFDDETPAAP